MIAPIPENPEHLPENLLGRGAENAPPPGPAGLSQRLSQDSQDSQRSLSSQSSSVNSISRAHDGEKLADELEHLFEHQDQLLRKVHIEQERLTSALRELATAMECERRARGEKPHGREEEV